MRARISPSRADASWASAAASCAALAAAIERSAGAGDGASAAGAHPGSGDWLASWRRADALVPRLLAEVEDPFEPRVYAGLEPALPDGATVWVSSSMPIRDVETFFPQSPRRLRFLSNRGANGIDGVVSSAAGAALAAGERAFLLTGELALLHDLGGVLAARRAGAELTIVCVNNGGGGIFDFLPVAEHADAATYEQHVATPADLDVRRVADLAGLRYELVTSTDELRVAAGAAGLVEVRTDRHANRARHRELLARLSAQLDAERSPSRP